MFNILAKLKLAKCKDEPFDFNVENSSSKSLEEEEVHKGKCE